MKISGDYTFEAPKEVVWKALLDPEVLAQVLPGCDKLEIVGENEYEGALNVKVGPVQGKFSGKVKLEDIVEHTAYTMKVDGRGASGFVKATAHVKLADADGGTRMDYDSDAQVGGRIASVGQRLMESSAKAITKQSLDGLSQVMAARHAAAAEGAEAPAPVEVKTPTQAQFAAGVAKEVAKDLLPSGARVALIVGALVIIAAMVYIILT